MILGQVSWPDCLVFIIFLAIQLIYCAGLFRTILQGLKALPFLLVKLPYGFITERFLIARQQRSLFVQRASWFEDITIRCVRYAFRAIPADICRMFFSKHVALPFIRFRMLRHGYIRSPIHYQKIVMDNFKGLWISDSVNSEPDIIIFYVHGGGFLLGSTYFYLEFLIAFLHVLTGSGYKRPAIFAVEYTLVPDKAYPEQPSQVLAAYQDLCANHDSSTIVLAGDSAGGTLVLSLLLKLQSLGLDNSTPLAVLISPWVTLVDSKDHNTASDYLDVNNLHHYAYQYAGSQKALRNPLVSPGMCADPQTWKLAAPKGGFVISWSDEEIFNSQIESFVRLLKDSGVHIDAEIEEGGVHAWTVASLFLSATEAERLNGLLKIAQHIRRIMVGQIDTVR